jgi:hypothetical protein
MILWLACLQLVFLVSGKSGNEVVEVEIATWGLTKPVATLLGTLPFIGPVLDSSVEKMRVKYAGKINFTLTYVVDGKSKNCLDLADNIDYLMSKWYYERGRAADVSVFIGPGRKIQKKSRFFFSNRLRESTAPHKE